MEPNPMKVPDEKMAYYKECCEVPGKFEGKTPATVYFYELWAEGFQDDFIWDNEREIPCFFVKPEDVANFPELEGVEVFGFWESDQGFINGIWWNSLEDYNADKDKCGDSTEES